MGVSRVPQGPLKLITDPIDYRQVLLMNPAPIIGLSATVGDPERFSNWLASVEESCGRKYSLVQQ